MDPFDGYTDNSGYDAGFDFSGMDGGYMDPSAGMNDFNPEQFDGGFEADGEYDGMPTVQWIHGMHHGKMGPGMMKIPKQQKFSGMPGRGGGGMKAPKQGGMPGGQKQAGGNRMQGPMGPMGNMGRPMGPRVGQVGMGCPPQRGMRMMGPPMGRGGMMRPGMGPRYF